MKTSDKYDRVIAMLLAKLSSNAKITEQARSVFYSIPYNKLIISLVIADLEEGDSESQVAMKYYVTQSCVKNIKKQYAKRTISQKG